MNSEFTKQERKDAKAAYNAQKKHNPVKHSDDRDALIGHMLKSDTPRFDVKISVL